MKNNDLFEGKLMRRYFSFVIIACLTGCMPTTGSKKPTCKVKAELLLPTSYGDSTEVKKIFKRRFNKLYPISINNALKRNHVNYPAHSFEFVLEDQKHANRVMNLYLTGYLKCNCINLLDTLLAELHSNFLLEYPDQRTIQFETKMESIAKKLDSLEHKIQTIKNSQSNINHPINPDTIRKMENEWMKINAEKEALKVKNAAYLYEFFTVLNSGGSVL